MSRILVAAALALAVGSVGTSWAQTQSTAPTTDAGTKLNIHSYADKAIPNFTVESVDAAAKRTKDSRGEVLDGPSEVPGGSWILQCRDPQGAAFALVAPKR